MAATNSIENPVFEELAAIQAGIDEFPNRYDKSAVAGCRALIADGSRRCKHKCSEEKQTKIKELLSEFEDMTECPETSTFYKKMEELITLTHCASHYKVALKAFGEWKKQRTLAPSSPPPASPYSSSSASITADDIFSASPSEASDTSSQTSTEDRPIYAVSDCESEDLDEPGAQSVTDETAVPVATRNGDAEIDVSNSDQKNELRFPGLGIHRPRRTRSLRDHSRLFQEIMEHPSEKQMQEGIVYVLEHKESGLFKIGFSTKGAEARLRQPRNCYGINTNIIYETKERFRGAEKAEKIIHTSLTHQNIIIKECEKCGGGHREWFEASREKILDAVAHVEGFVQMPAYVKESNEWKLTAEAYKDFTPMSGFKLSALAKNKRAIKENGGEAGKPLEVISETTPETVCQGTDECEVTDSFVETEESQSAGNPSGHKIKKRGFLGRKFIAWFKKNEPKTTHEADAEIQPKKT